MEWSRIAEGETILASVFIDQLMAAQDRVNALPSTAVEPHSLTREHLPSPVVDIAFKSISPTSQHEYDDNYEPYPGWNTVAGWRTINTNGSYGTGIEVKAAWQDNAFIDLTTGEYKILILLNVHLVRMYEDAAGVISNDFFCVIAIQAKDQNGNWRHIARTERYCDAQSWTDSTGTSMQLRMYKDMAVRTLLTHYDADGVFTNLPDVAEVRAVVSIVDGTSGHAAQLVKVYLKEATLTALAFYAGRLE